MTSPFSTGVPVNPAEPIAMMPNGTVNPVWYQFFVNMWFRTGGAVAGLSPLLDAIIALPGSIIYRGAANWTGLGPGVVNQVLQMGAAFPQWQQLDPAALGRQNQNTVLAAPAGATGDPSFRTLVSSDLNSVAGQYPAATGAASAGNLGEYISSQIVSGAAVALTSGVAADVTHIILTPGDWDVWATLVTAPDPTTTQSDIKGWAGIVSATDPGPPNNGCYAELQTAIAAGLTQSLSLGKQRILALGGETIYLSANVTFATSTLKAYGFLGARRV